MLSGRQFHQMSRGEFESQPGTMFHGNPTGNFNWDQPKSPYGFHVGSHAAASEAVVSRAGHGAYSDSTSIPAPLRGEFRDVEIPGSPFKRSEAVAHPESLRGGRIEAPMVNSPSRLGRYGGHDEGYGGDMHDSGDSRANAKAREIASKGQTMRRGIYYVNQAEDAGSLSAVLPSRQSWKTHEDYLVEARAAGKRVPRRALHGYSEIPGQQRLF